MHAHRHTFACMLMGKRVVFLVEANKILMLMEVVQCLHTCLPDSHFSTVAVIQYFFNCSARKSYLFVVLTTSPSCDGARNYLLF